jgi:hypothetical protein
VVPVKLVEASLPLLEACMLYSLVFTDRGEQLAYPIYKGKIPSHLTNQHNVVHLFVTTHTHIYV